MVARRSRGVGQGVVRRSAGRTTKTRKSLTCDADTGRYTSQYRGWKWNAPLSHPRPPAMQVLDAGAGGLDKDSQTNEGPLLAWGARRKKVEAADPTRRMGPDAASLRCSKLLSYLPIWTASVGRDITGAALDSGRAKHVVAKRSPVGRGLHHERSWHLPHSGKVHVLFQH